jgi:hypothetical protein
MGLKANVMQKAVTASNLDIIGSVFGKNKSLSSTDKCTYSIKSKYSNNVPIESKKTASFCALVSFLAMIVFPNDKFITITLLGTFY